MKDEYDFSSATRGRFYRPNLSSVSRPNPARDDEFEQYILEGMARSLWLVAFQEFTEEYNYFPRGVAVMDRDDPRAPFSDGESGDWDTVTPNTPQTRAASLEGAKALASVFARVNHLGARPMTALFVMDVRNEQGREPGAPGAVRRGANGATWGDLAYVFGEDLAQISMGRMDPGAILLAPTITIPSTKVHYDSQDLTWEIDGESPPSPAPLGDIRDL